MNSAATGDGSIPTQAPRRSRAGLWWALGGGLTIIVLVVAAVLIIPRVLHAQRVATYTDLVAQTNTLLSESQELRAQSDQTTVLYALQLEEARALQPVLGSLAEYSDHYFSEADLAALAEASDTLAQATTEDGLTDAEAQLTDQAKDAITARGLIWQTDFLNLTPDAVAELVDPSPASRVTPVTDDDVTDTVLEEAGVALQAAESEQLQAETELAAAETRSDALHAAIVAALDPLRSSSLSAPDQAEVVLNMYPNADAEIVTQLRDSAKLSADSVSASTFTFNDDYDPIPLEGEAPSDKVSVTATDAWRAVIIATHLDNYSGAVTAAWISDSGGIEQALGFNPFLPFFMFP